MKEQTLELNSERRRKTGIRDAVETAIDLAKQDPSASWEEQIAQDPRRISRWEEGKEPPQKKA